MTLEEAKEKLAQAFQVVAYMDEAMAGGCEKPSSPDMILALNYFCDDDVFDENFLPWPRFKA